jgi:Ca2+-binding RTX toxin-like protein
MNSVQITTTETTKIDAQMSDTDYIFTQTADITTGFGFDIDATSNATYRTIYLDGQLHGNGGGIDVGDVANGQGGGQLYIGATGVIDVANAGIYSGGDYEFIVTAGHISGSTGIYAHGASSSIWNSGSLHGTLLGVYMTGADETVRNSGLILAPEALTLGGGADTRNHVLNSGAITGSSNAIIGSDGTDIIRNTGIITGKVDLGAGNDLFDGRGGTVTGVVSGGAGNDRYNLSDAKTAISEALGGGIDTVKASFGYTLGRNVENLVLTGSKELTGTGNGMSNHLTGNAGVNILDGGKGKDVLDGGRDSDFLTGGVGADTFSFHKHSGSDTVLDFQATGAGHDRVDLSLMMGIGNLADVLDHAEQHGNSVVLDFGHGDEMTLRHTDLASLSANDFVF